MSTMSKGQNILMMYLFELFPAHTPRIDYRPEWLCGLELDFYYEEFKLAFEFNGRQHLKECNLPNDTRKRSICSKKGISLLTIETSDLRYSILRPMILKVLASHVKKYVVNKNRESEREFLKLDNIAIKYREAAMREKDPSAYPKNTKIRKSLESS